MEPSAMTSLKGQLLWQHYKVNYHEVIVKVSDYDNVIRPVTMTLLKINYSDILMESAAMTPTYS